MSEDVRLVTVGTFPDVSLAYLAKGRLEEAGITSFIANENTGGWLPGLGVTWPTVQVAEEDAMRAIAVLESHFGTEEAEEEEDPQGEAPEGAITLRDQFARFNRSTAEPEAKAPPEEEEQEEHPAIDKAAPEDRSATAERAFRAALVGVLFAPSVLLSWPLPLYSTWLLLRVWESKEPLTDRARWRAWAALWLNVLVLVGAGLIARQVLSWYW